MVQPYDNLKDYFETCKYFYKKNFQYIKSIVTNYTEQSEFLIQERLISFSWLPTHTYSLLPSKRLISSYFLGYCTLKREKNDNFLLTNHYSSPNFFLIVKNTLNPKYDRLIYFVRKISILVCPFLLQSSLNFTMRYSSV